MLNYQQILYSFVQVRGSIPLFWYQKQKGLKAIIDIKRPEHLTSQAFLKHFNSLITDYKKVVMINLTKKTKPEEDKLRVSLEKLLHWHRIENLKHVYYDFHEETHGDKFYRVNDLIKQLSGFTEKFGYFVRHQFGTRKVIKLQKGVYRTNCIDCLDRTNVIQTRISLRIVEIILDSIRHKTLVNGIY